MNQRIKELRKHLKLTQPEFAEKIGVSANYVWLLEKGDRTIGDRALKDLCELFNVSEEWLRHGTGDMFLPDKDEDDRIIEECSDNPVIRSIVRAYLQLTDQNRQALLNFAQRFAAEMHGTSMPEEIDIRNIPLEAPPHEECE